jgi:hypothetical protein
MLENVGKQLRAAPCRVEPRTTFPSAVDKYTPAASLSLPFSEAKTLAGNSAEKKN